jgi:CcmD family protein
MIKILKKVLIVCVLLVISISAFAQDNQSVEMADGLYQSGKIYVVIAVIAVIFLGIVGYLVMLDRKISKLEKGS